MTQVSHSWRYELCRLLALGPGTAVRVGDACRGKLCEGTRNNRVDGDAGSPRLRCQGSGQSPYSSLGRRVGQMPAGTVKRGATGRHDDAGIRGTAEQRPGRLGHEPGTEEMNIERTADIACRGVRPAASGDARIVDYRVQSPERALRACGKALCRLLLSDIPDDREHAAVGQRALQCAQALAVHVHEHQVGAQSRQQSRVSASQPSCCAGDRNRPACVRQGRAAGDLATQASLRKSRGDTRRSDYGVYIHYTEQDVIVTAWSGEVPGLPSRLQMCLLRLRGEAMPRLGYPRESFIPRGFGPSDSVPPEVDPVTYEILRHRLEMINEENGSTILETSGSPVVLFGRDYNSALLTARGEYLFFGRGVQIHAGVMDLAVRFLLEEYSISPGIADGDVFVTNDPWISSGHANDVVVVSPVFVDGELTYWVANALHHIDLGGGTAGSRDTTSISAFQEGTLFPPLKVVDGGIFRRDVASVIERQSRLRPYLALDLRAQVAGVRVARERMLAMVDEFGAEAVSATAERILSSAADAFCQRLDSLPDGEWRERAYIDGRAAGDRSLYRVGLRLTKTGSALTFSDDETSPQVEGPINTTYSGWRSGIICSLMTAMCNESGLSPGGALRFIDFCPGASTLMSASFPAAVNRATGLGVGVAAGLATRLLARMVAPDADQLGQVTSVNGSEPLLGLGMTGRRGNGRSFLRVFTDTVACGSGAMMGLDGDATGGSTINLGAVIPNVEEYEAAGAFLYLFRRECKDTGGAGQYRGGNAISYGLVPFDNQACNVQSTGWSVAFPMFQGLFGALGSASRYVEIVRNSNIWDEVAGGRWPASLDECSGDRQILPGQVQDLPLTPSDVVAVIGGAGGGVGDPLVRAPASVKDDVLNGRISLNAARCLYGVVLSASGDLDAGATKVARRACRASRLGREPLDLVEPVLAGAGPHPWIRSEQDALICAGCGRILGVAAGPYLSGCHRRHLPVEQLGDGHLPPTWFTDTEVEVVEYSCPSCGLRIEVDIAPAGEPLLDSLAVPTQARRSAE
jgi:N-methylhydantoinase B